MAKPHNVDIPVNRYARISPQAQRTPAVGPSPLTIYEYNEPGEAERRAN